MRELNAWIKDATHVVLNDARIATWTTKPPNPSKPWLLLIHGFPTSSWDWTGVWPALEKHFNITALDMLGFGLSDKPRNFDYRITDQADFQEMLLEHLGVSEIHILAHDYGDTVAQELLARYEQSALSFSIKSVCFLNGGLFPEQHRARTIQRLGLTPLGPVLSSLMSRSTLRTNFNQIFGRGTKASEDEIDAHWALLNYNNGRRVFHKLLQYIPERIENRERWVGALQNSTIPMRLINGGADPISGKHLYDYYASMIENPDTVLLEKIGHYPQTEAPQQVVDAFLQFHKNHRTF